MWELQAATIDFRMACTAVFSDVDRIAVAGMPRMSVVERYSSDVGAARGRPLGDGQVAALVGRAGSAACPPSGSNISKRFLPAAFAW